MRIAKKRCPFACVGERERERGRGERGSHDLGQVAPTSGKWSQKRRRKTCFHTHFAVPTVEFYLAHCISQLDSSHFFQSPLTCPYPHVEILVRHLPIGDRLLNKAKQATSGAISALLIAAPPLSSDALDLNCVCSQEALPPW